MIVNKSMFPLQTGFGVISKMQDRFATLQMQLGTGMKSQTLAGLGRDLPLSLSVRSRLSAIDGYKANIDTANLRLSFLDNAMTRFDKVEAEARSSAVQGQYGTHGINMATLPGLSKARLDEMVTLLNSEIAGRYLFGGNKTDQKPIPDTAVLLNGQGGRDGFETVVSERKAADLGSGRGRLDTSVTAPTVFLAEDGVHPFGMKVSTISSNSGAVTVAQPHAGVAPQGKQVSITFSDLPSPLQSGQTISIGLTMPDGTESQVKMRAVTSAEYSGSPDEFVIGDTPDLTAANFKKSLDDKLFEVGRSELEAASTFAASQNFFNGPGEPVLRVEGNPATATALRIGTAADTIMWYGGQTPAVSATGMGRLDSAASGTMVSLTERAPFSADHGFHITNATATGGTTATAPAGSPAGVEFDLAAAADGDVITLTLSQPPNDTPVTLRLTAVTGRAGPGQFSVGSGATPEQIAANFHVSLNDSVTRAATSAEGNPRQSVTAQVDETARVNYGMQATESGFLRLMRTMASMAVESYPSDENIRNSLEPMRQAAMAEPEGPLRDAALAKYQAQLTADFRASQGRFDGMAIRQQAEMSEGHNAEAGSIEIVTMELGVARSHIENATKRHTNYSSQLLDLLSDIETVSKEDVAMEILALQTRLQASYQVTSMVSQLSLINFMR
jgi:flagellin-like hook-associated protein FlgL